MEYLNPRWHPARQNPMAAWDVLGGQTWSNGPLPFSLAASHQRFAQVYSWFQAVIAPFGKPAFGIDRVEIDGRACPVTMSVEVDTPFCQLLAFRCPTAPAAAPRRRVLLVAPLAGHHAVLMRDAVQSLLAFADVFVTDWSDARDVPLAAGGFSLDGFVRLLESFITTLGTADLHVMAVCQATVPALAAVARLSVRTGDEPRSLTLVGGPIDARLAPTMLNRVAAGLSLPWLDATAIDAVPRGYLGEGRRIYPGFLQYPALVAAQPDRHVSLMFDYFYRRHASEPDEAQAIERQVAQYGAVLDMAAEFFLDTVRVVFQQSLLARNAWDVAGQRVEPARLARVALLTVEGDRDDISGAGQTHAAHGLCSGLPRARRERVTIDRCTHYDLFAGAHWRESIYPRVHGWMAAHD